MLIGIDVGTGSARAGVFDASGALLGVGKHPLTLWHEPGDIVEQSSDQIWAAICAAVHEAMTGLDPAKVTGIGFDATCSLVVVDKDGKGIAVGPSNDPARNVMVWMDHRAAAEAEEINTMGHPVLDYVGGRISPEMETPKLLWLSRHRPQAFLAAAHFFDLPDYLTWRATGSLQRSICTVTCKWTWLAHENRWDDSYFRAIGLATLADEGFARIGTDMVNPGDRIGRLTETAARDIGLPPGIPVAASLIDAHAGGVGTLSASVSRADDPVTARLAYVFGTSACSMASTRAAVAVPGVWGPYYNAMIPGLWLNEGGQSAAGAALDHLVHLHIDAPLIAEEAKARGLSLVTHLAAHAETLGATRSDTIRAVGDLIVVPEFLGNRSPFAEPEARAVISGLGLDRGIDSLARLYLAGLSGIGYGLRQLLDRLDDKGITIRTIVASGGAVRNDLVCQMIADATGRTVALPDQEEPVLLGAAMLAAVAGGTRETLGQAMSVMSGAARVFVPADGDLAALHQNRYASFKALQSVARQIRTGTITSR